MSRKSVIRAVLLLIAAAVVLGSGPLIDTYVDLLWFVEVGHARVWWTIVGAQLLLGTIFGVATGVIVYGNALIARRISPPLTPRLIEAPVALQMMRLAQRTIRWLILAGCLFVALVVAGWAADHWETILLHQNAQPFGVKDPIFGKDIGFYVFSLPFWQFLYQWALATLVLSLAVATIVYFLERQLEIGANYARVAAGVRAHLSALLGVVALVVAGGLLLRRYDLLFRDNGILHGAGYTDVHVRIPMLVVLAVIALLVGAAFFYNIYRRDLRLPLIAGAFYLVASFVLGTIYPALQQRFVVQPNELAMERPYLRHHLEATRRAFGLDRVRSGVYRMTGSLTAETLEREQATLRNVRLWHPHALGEAYQALQSLRGYYDVTEVDVDRYRIGGEYRQVMLAARRIVATRIQDRRWVNQRLVYTHGNGVVASPVNEVEESGQPIFWLRNLPIESTVELRVTRPEIYYSDLPAQPVIAPSRADEFDYPKEPRAEFTRYAGRGGIPIGGLWRRLVFSIHLGDANIALSDQITPQSRILIRRQIDERVARVAPFLRYEHDPYLVITRDGRLVYLLDAYTATDRYPYSAPYPLGYSRLRELTPEGLRERDPGDPTAVRYLRNSVKATIDAYDGSIRLYVADPTDPVLRTYQRIFPTLFQPLEAMPADLREHIRYPEDLLNVQARVLRAYHVTDPDSFYNNDDLWEVATETVRPGEQRDAPGLPPLRAAPPPPNPPMDPYYLIMKLPEADGSTGQEEFVLVLPMVLKGRENMIAWLAGRSDGANYGQLVLYSFPRGAPPDSPQLVDNRIQQHPAISAQITLWDSAGSQVQYGNLQVLPLADTLVYVRPLFLRPTGGGRAGGSAFPELQQVIAVHGTRVVMRPRLPEALAELVGGARRSAPAPTGRPRPPAPTGTPQERLRSLGEQLQRELEAMDQAQRAGRWAEYGERLEAVKRLAGELNQELRQNPP